MDRKTLSATVGLLADLHIKLEREEILKGHKVIVGTPPGKMKTPKLTKAEKKAAKRHRIETRLFAKLQREIAE